MKNNYFSDIVWHCNYQLVLVPRNMATSAFCILRRELETIFADICRRLEVDILSLEISQNHVYIQLSIHPRNSPLEVVRSLKNISTSELFQRYSGLLHILEGKSFWTDGCLLYTKALSKQTIQNYIGAQLEADWWAGCNCAENSL